MKAWRQLVKKEFFITRNGILIGLAALLFLFLFVVNATERGEINLLILTVMMFFLHTFYLPIYVFLSLNAETKYLHLWLHSEQPAAKLLLAKLFVGSLSMFLSALLTGSFGLYALNSAGAEFFPTLASQSLFHVLHTGEIIYLAFILSAVVFIGAISTSAWVLLIWGLYHSFLKKVGKWGWIVGIFIPFICLDLLGQLKGTSFYQTMEQLFGTISFEYFHQILAKFTNGKVTFLSNVPSFYLLYDVILILVLFFITTRLIDKKVEV